MTTCNARTGTRRTPWGEDPQWCHQWRGLRSYVDADGMTRYACAAFGHLAQVLHRYPPLPSLSAQEDAVYASLDRENAYFRAHEDEPWTEGELREAWGS